MCSLRLEFVTAAADGFDIFPTRAELAAELFDMGIHRACVSIIVITPDVVEDFVPRQRHAGVGNQIVEQFKFGIGQFHRTAVHPHLAAGCVDIQAGCLCRGFGGRRSSAAEDRLDACQQDFQAERLGDVFVDTKGKTMKLWAADVLKGTFEGVPGEIIKVEKERFLVRTGDGALAVKELQLEGKKRMDAASFLRGFSLEEGEILCQG